MPRRALGSFPSGAVRRGHHHGIRATDGGAPLPVPTVRRPYRDTDDARSCRPNTSGHSTAAGDMCRIHHAVPFRLGGPNDIDELTHSEERPTQTEKQRSRGSSTVGPKPPPSSRTLTTDLRTTCESARGSPGSNNRQRSSRRSANVPGQAEKLRRGIVRQADSTNTKQPSILLTESVSGPAGWTGRRTSPVAQPSRV